MSDTFSVSFKKVLSVFNQRLKSFDGFIEGMRFDDLRYNAESECYSFTPNFDFDPHATQEKRAEYMKVYNDFWGSM